MTDTTIYRPVPSLVRILAQLTVLSAAALLVLGGLVTTLRAGMSDTRWPTSPTHLAENPDILRGENTGLKIEHSHRVLGFLTGGLATLLALAAWQTEPSRTLRWTGLLLVLVLVVIYGQFHRAMGVAWSAREAGGGLNWPRADALATAAASLGLLLAAVFAARARRQGWAVRVFASVALISVMIQGLLGGFRVFLDQIMGTELAAVHGTFAQLVFCLLTAVVILTAPRRAGDTLPPEDQARVGWWSLIVVGILLVQLVWGVWLRHVGSPASQRLHVLTAFVVTGAAAWMCVLALATPSGRARLGFLAYHLLGILVLQVILGVESWMGKFAAAGPQAAVPPPLRDVSAHAAGIRTAHVLIGTALLASSVAFAMRVWRKPVELPAVDG